MRRAHGLWWGNTGKPSPLAYKAWKAKETFLLCELLEDRRLKGLGTNTMEEMHPVQPVNNLEAPISKHQTTKYSSGQPCKEEWFLCLLTCLRSNNGES